MTNKGGIMRYIGEKRVCVCVCVCVYTLEIITFKFIFISSGLEDTQNASSFT
jgi:hypothetical protein